jgi:nucleotide-binding universal stress UspA family protein
VSGQPIASGPPRAYVVGIDGSGPSLAAVRWAAPRAASASIPLLLVHVIDDERVLIAGDPGVRPVAGRDGIVREALDLARALGVRDDLDSRVLEGSPVRQLARSCRHDDLLVIGTHKTGFLRGRVLGSRSVSVASLAPCSIVVVPEGRGGRRHGVVVGVARSDGSLRCVESGAREAARSHQSLTLLHAESADRDRGAWDDEADQQRLLLQHAAGGAPATAPDVDARTRVTSRPPAEALLDASRDAALLVVEPSRRSGSDPSVIGSTTHDVLMNLTSPVLVVRNDAI